MCQYSNEMKQNRKWCYLLFHQSSLGMHSRTQNDNEQIHQDPREVHNSAISVELEKESLTMYVALNCYSV